MGIVPFLAVIVWLTLLYLPFHFLLLLFGDLGLKIYGYGFIPSLGVGVVYFLVRTETYLIESLKSTIKLKKFDVYLKN